MPRVGARRRLMIGHGAARDIDLCVGRPRAYTAAPDDAESVRPVRGPGGAGEPLGAARRPGANPGRMPGSADRSREPVSSPRRPTPTVDPSQRAFARRPAAAFVGPTARHGGAWAAATPLAPCPAPHGRRSTG